MEIKKCQKCGSENILLIKINPDYDEFIQESFVECQDCGFKIKKRIPEEVDDNWFNKNILGK
jgi:DNA-directed RNA polymerase subunit RPC12/RpoP